MKKLEIKFIDNYYSFKKNENFTFSGDFIILSGFNGTGKTQMLKAMSQLKEENVAAPYLDKISKKYVVHIEQDGQQIDYRKIRLLNFQRTFQYNTDFPSTNENYFEKIINNVFAFYKNEILPYKNFFDQDKNFFDQDESQMPFLHNNHNINEPYVYNSGEIQKFISLIKEKIPKENWFKLSKQEIKELLPNNFEWPTSTEDQKLLKKIGQIFLNYVNKREEEKQKCINHKDNQLKSRYFDDEKWLSDAPWTLLNKLFKDLNFKYRFLDDYEKDFWNIGLKDPIILKDKGNGDSRHLSELSDGEKTLLDLSLTSFEFKGQGIKLVLFDEYDAFLNPSMIENFYKILKTFYSDFQVILVTHNITTIFQAPDEAHFYELFADENGVHKIIETVRQEYLDMKLFLEKLNLKDRIAFLNCPLFVVSEGKDNKEYIEHILINVYGYENAKNILIWSGGGKDDLFINLDNFKRLGKKIMFVWDCDVKEQEIERFKEDHMDEINQKIIILYQFDKNLNNLTVDSGIENNFDESITNKFMNNSKIDKKSLKKYLLQQTDKKIFENFEPFVEKVKKLLEIKQ